MQLNDAACEFLDIPRKQLLGVRMAEFVSDESRRPRVARYARVIDNGESLVAESFPGSKSDGEAQRRFDLKAVK